ncbi:unnamed protein product [Periconia digitata]|uniref:Uncharacterized protein n=1 Tax=Periconia digitata TaxID=1303443 RepID=A0A9W4XCY2_9PLEO|nr:unnamed protein product [Periconia digitata]
MRSPLLTDDVATVDASQALGSLYCKYLCSIWNVTGNMETLLLIPAQPEYQAQPGGTRNATTTTTLKKSHCQK